MVNDEGPIVPNTPDKEVIRALRMLFEDFEDRIQYQEEVLEDSTSEVEEEASREPVVHVAHVSSYNEESEELIPRREPQLYLCDDWIQPIEVMRRPRELAAKQKMRANAISERYQQERIVTSPFLNSVTLTDEELSACLHDSLEIEGPLTAAPAAMPPPTRLLSHRPEVNHTGDVEARDTSLKLYHVMSVKQTLREDLAEHAYQFSCRAADWSRSDFCSVPMQFEPLEMHVVDALGQQEVPDYFQQPAKAITEDVSVMRGPYALEWIAAVREEIESFKRLGVYEEVPKRSATSTPLPEAKCSWQAGKEEG